MPTPLVSETPPSITDTVVGPSVPAFLRNLETVERCFRCHRSIAVGEKWANFCQVIQFKTAKPQIVGGLLCHSCVESWVEWRS